MKRYVYKSCILQEKTKVIDVNEQVVTSVEHKITSGHHHLETLQREMI